MQTPRLTLTQKQQLKMTPQMYQSLELLTLPVLDLREKIQEEIEKNPALEFQADRSVSYERITQGPPQRSDVFENSSDPGYISRTSEEKSDANQKYIEGAFARGESLQDHLLWQLHVSPISPEERELGEVLISNLDGNGFYQQPLDEVVIPRLAPVLERTLEMIRGFDPPGICVEGPIESLLLQVRLSGDAPEHTETFIMKELEQLKRGKFTDLSRSYGIAVEEVEEIFAYIRTLNPYPGSSWSSASTEYVVPDITIRRQGRQLRLYIHNEQIPELKIDEAFREMGESSDQVSKETKRYIQQSIRDAQWLISSLEMRTGTLRKVGAALMKFQYEFFLKGPKHLRPMTLKHIAEEVSVHETTVSRISHAKYVQTDWGIFPVKYFFSSSISSTSSQGEDYAKNSVKEIMRELIESYTGKKRLSDQKISDMLGQRGIKIARRTVAKYRKELNIESSFDRS